MLYHYTCQFWLPFIFQTGGLIPSSDLDKLPPLVWLTDSPTPDNMGLLFDANMPAHLNKTHIRITVRKMEYMRLWEEWSDDRGIDRELKQAMIVSANAEETYKTWYVSERAIPIGDVLLIENLVTGKVLYKRGAKGG